MSHKSIQSGCLRLTARRANQYRSITNPATLLAYFSWPAEEEDDSPLLADERHGKSETPKLGL